MFVEREGLKGPLSACKSVTASEAKSARPKNFDRSWYAAYGKRGLDILVCLILLPLLLPLFAVLYFFVTKDGGPFFYAQERIGVNGRKFGCLKIRSMILNADEVLQELLERDPKLAKEWETKFKLAEDPRITKIGRFLRSTSLDELPQLFNVLGGHMSIVGPRPITQEEVVAYGEEFETYCLVRPGLTGPWQISGRRTADFTRRAGLDAKYVTSLSPLRDVYIMFATLPEVFLAKGR